MEGGKQTKEYPAESEANCVPTACRRFSFEDRLIGKLLESLIFMFAVLPEKQGRSTLLNLFALIT